MSKARCRGRGLFLETSAQIERIFGSLPIKEDVRKLCKQFRTVGTSAFVLAEFNAVIGGFMKAASQALRRLPNLDEARPFPDIWLEVEHLLPYKYGSSRLANRFALFMSHHLGSVPTTPRYIVRTLDSQFDLASGQFYRVGKVDMKARNMVFDRTSCCLWETKQTNQCMHPTPQPHCKLEENCWTGRQRFESAVKRLTDAPVEERTVLNNQLPRLERAASCFEYLTTITGHPNAFGDVLVVSEVPDGWSVLTKDHAYPILAEHAKRDLEVLMVRLPRRRLDLSCDVRRESQELLSGFIQLENASLRDVGLKTTVRIGARRTKVSVKFDGKWHEGYVAREEREEREGSDGLYHYGIRITRLTVP